MTGRSPRPRATCCSAKSPRRAVRRWSIRNTPTSARSARRCCPDITARRRGDQLGFQKGEQAMDLGLQGKSVLVTGGSKGIGLAVANLFAAEGVNVAICGRNSDDVGKAVKMLAAKGVKAWGQGIDVGDPVALKGWIDGAAEQFGGIDCVVCNVSALAVGDTEETWEKSFRVDMMHTVNSVAASVPYLEKSTSAS